MAASAWHLTSRRFASLLIGFLLLISGQTVQTQQPGPELERPNYQYQHRFPDLDIAGDMGNNGGYKTVAYYVNWVRRSTVRPD